LYTTLVIKSTPENVAEVVAVVRELDRAPRNLLVTVSHGDSNRHRRDGADLAVAASGEGASAAVRVFDTRSTTEGSETQGVRVLEGHEAFIRFGESVPVAQRSFILFGAGLGVEDSITYEDVTSGFYVLPRLAGDRVTLEISPYRRNLSDTGGGAFDVREASTTIAGRLGEWIPLAGSTNQAEGSATGTVYATRSYEAEQQAMYLRVEVVD
jgi:type II secretory pathway component GspD/PulD (secretin)